MFFRWFLVIYVDLFSSIVFYDFFEQKIFQKVKKSNLYWSDFLSKSHDWAVARKSLIRGVGASFLNTKHWTTSNLNSIRNWNSKYLEGVKVFVEHQQMKFLHIWHYSCLHMKPQMEQCCLARLVCVSPSPKWASNLLHSW